MITKPNNYIQKTCPKCGHKEAYFKWIKDEEKMNYTCTTCFYPEFGPLPIDLPKEAKPRPEVKEKKRFSFACFLNLHYWSLKHVARKDLYFECVRCDKRKVKHPTSGKIGGFSGGPILANEWLEGGNWEDPFTRFSPPITTGIFPKGVTR